MRGFKGRRKHKESGKTKANFKDYRHDDKGACGCRSPISQVLLPQYNSEKAKSAEAEDDPQNESDNVSLEAQAYDMLFDYVRNDLLENPRVVKLSDLCAQLLSFMKMTGVEDVRGELKSKNKHFFP